ncbi:MAG: hypothetical protein HOE75_05565 [Chloroflexi bacterium]|nr:hypothetical protein [Chloroflexota bacterium]
MSSKFFKRIAAPGLLGLALLAALLFATIGGDSDASANNGVRGLDRAIAAQEAHNGNLLALDGVVGTGVGPGGSGSAVVFVLTESADVAGIPSRLDGVTVIPTVTGKVTALHHRANHDKGGGGSDPTPTPGPDPTPDPTPSDPTVRFDRPVPIGVSTGHPSITAGTIGARVTDGTNVFALSNNHVYADENAAALGDAVIQPGSFDGGSSSADDIGTLSAFIPIAFDGSANTVDAAIALSSEGQLGNATLSAGYGTPDSTTVSATSRMKVQKYGRTTGFTKSRVWATNVSVNVGYDSGTALFTGQIAVRGAGFSAGGDSGSLVVTQSGNNPVGLLFAGGGQYTFLNPIDDVLSAFGVTVDGK